MSATTGSRGSELRQRVITGVVGAATLIGLILFGGAPGMLLVTGVIVLAMVFEYSRLVFHLPDAREKRYFLLVLAWFAVVGHFLAVGGVEFELLTLCFLALATYFLATARRYADFADHFREMMLALGGLVYVVFTTLYLPRIHALAGGERLTLLFLALVWATDTGAYFVGRRYGRRKLYAEVSPKKSVEGALGGLAVALVVAIVAKLSFAHQLSWGGTIVTPLVVSAVAQIGDLFESFLKRASACKDSGSFLPGHGGFLDRFDGVVFSAPVMYACIRVFGS